MFYENHSRDTYLFIFSSRKPPFSKWSLANDTVYIPASPLREGKEGECFLNRRNLDRGERLKLNYPSRRNVGSTFIRGSS